MVLRAQVNTVQNNKLIKSLLTIRRVLPHVATKGRWENVPNHRLINMNISYIKLTFFLKCVFSPPDSVLSYSRWKSLDIYDKKRKK